MAKVLLALTLGAVATVSHGQVWPLPESVSSGDTNITVYPSTAFFVYDPRYGEAGALLKEAFTRYFDLTFPHGTLEDKGASMKYMSIAVESYDESHPQLETDESYSLSIDEYGNGLISAATVYGVMRGMETFSQLVVFDYDTRTYQISGAPLVIQDSPRFAHRGLMIDTARHFLPLASIRSIIDSLPYAKLNVLHWHMVDTQSFPFESTTYPKLWEGAYSKHERYLQSDITSIVDYAHARGVRVVVEFDVPGHAASWCVGYPEVCPSDPDCTQPLNVANNATFDLIESILGECTGKQASTTDAPSGLFPDAMIHLGGDEVDTSCWTADEDISAWLADQGMTEDEGYAYFVGRASDIAVSQGRRPIQWSEVYDHFGTDLNKGTIVHVWKSVTNVTEVVANGYDTLVNVGYVDQSWYLDNLDVAWAAVYSKDPCEGVPDDLCPLVLGGHGEMWGETVDASDLEQTVWPRMAAIAERLWSPKDTTDADAALPRIEAFRCLLNSRGIAAAPVNNENARDAPPSPASCFEQRRALRF